MKIIQDYEIENDEFENYCHDIELELINRSITDETFKKIYINKASELKSDYEKSDYILALMKMYNGYTGKAVDEKYFEIASKIDISGLVELSTSDEIINMRKKSLLSFFKKVSKSRKPRKLVKQKLDWAKGDCIYSCYKDKYVIGIVLEEKKEDILIALFYEEKLSSVNSLMEKKPLLVGWCNATTRKFLSDKSAKCFENFKNISNDFSKIIKYDFIKILKDNSLCGKDIYIDYYYFNSDAIIECSKFSQYDGYYIYMNHLHQPDIRRRIVGDGWNPISKQDYEMLKNYII